MADTPLGGRIIKVDHAGEHGALCIYTAQILLARLTAPGLVNELVEFREHERRHRALFAAELRRRNVRRCRSYAMCALGGFVLGALTGLFGRRAVAATTVAVERVVLRHLDEQIEALHGVDPAAVEVIGKIVAEERQHHDRSTMHLAADSFWQKPLQAVVAVSTETVIWLGMRL